MTSFFERLEARAREIDSLLCVGLDAHPELLAEDDAKAAYRFCLSIIEETSPLAAAFKVNAAFFEAFGADGWSALRDVIGAVGSDIPVLLDAKRGDLGSSSSAYAKAVFDELGADAVTLSPYMGRDALLPFLERTDKGVFILVRTSNPGAAEIQDVRLASGELVYEHVAVSVDGWGDNVGLVVGATEPEAMAAVRALAPEAWILAPGVGAQGGDLVAAVGAGIRADGAGLLVPVSRSIAQAADRVVVAKELRDAISEARRDHSPTDDLDRLAGELFKAGCIGFGEFTLKSGAVSPFYIDLRRLASHPKVLAHVAAAMNRLVAPLDFDHLAPIPYAAMPIGTAMSLSAARSVVYPRREVKEYGTAASVEGVFSHGERALVIDDLATTGASKLGAIAQLKEAGLEVEDIVVLIDREGGAGTELAEAGYRFHAVMTVTDLMARLERRGVIASAEAQSVAKFLNG